RLGQPAPLEGCEALIHAALAHVPGRYRGGGGADPASLIALNRDGWLHLCEQALAAGVVGVVFLSWREVYDALPARTPLPDGPPPAPHSLYARIKAEPEAGLAALARPGFAAASLRATGIYGPGQNHKWTGLFADYLVGNPVAPRIGTELHGDDLAAAALLILGRGATGAFNASDLTLDRRDLLAEIRRLTDCPHPLPDRATTPVSAMSCERLTALGWRPGGWPLLRKTLPAMLTSGGF